MKKIILFVALFLSILTLASCGGKKYKIKLYEAYDKDKLNFDVKKEFKNLGEDDIIYVYSNADSYTLYRFGGYKSDEETYTYKYFVCGAGKTSTDINSGQMNVVRFSYTNNENGINYTWDIGYYPFYPSV